jgi:hypothetical protein
MTPKIIGNHIQKMDSKLPLNSKFQLIILLKEWLKTSGVTIGDLRGKSSNPEALLWIKINNNVYKIHADTKREGVIAFLKNEANKNSWVIIPTEKSGELTKVTNDINHNSIPGLYMYRSI